MQVEIWSDVVCPWCYIGKRRFEEALGSFAHRDDVEVTWRSFELDPAAPPRREGRQIEHLARKYGMTLEQAEAAQDRVTSQADNEGLVYHLDRAQSGNSFDAHRLIHLAAAHGRQDEMKERLLAAYFTEGEPIGERDTLEKLGIDVGLDPTEVRAVLDGDTWATEVRAEEAEARALGITGVPFFVIDRAYGVSGAQPADVLLEALDTAWTAAHPLTMIADSSTGSTAATDGVASTDPAGADAGVCDDGSCEI